MQNAFVKIVCLSLLIFILTKDNFAQTATVSKFLVNIPLLDRKVDENTNFNLNTISEVAMKSFNRTYTIGGVSILFDGDEETKYTLKPETYYQKDVLDSIVEAEPLYQWKIQDGLINLVPKKNYPVLETKINNFYIYNATKEEMIETLLISPEFQSAIKEAKVEKKPFYCCGGLCTTQPQRNTINLQNSTVQEVLNEIVRLNGRSVWRYREYSATYNEITKRYYDLNFMVNFGADCSSYEN
jgi:hypothetical protein